MKNERFQLINVNEKDILRKFAKSNGGYSKPQTLRPGDIEYEYVFRIPTPSIIYDSNVLSVNAGGITVGYIKKGSYSRVKKLIEQGQKCRLEIGGGKYVTNNLNGRGDFTIYKGSTRIWANLIIY